MRGGFTHQIIRRCQCFFSFILHVYNILNTCDIDRVMETAEVDRILRKFPNKVPVFLIRDKSTSSLLPIISKSKFLVPSFFSIAEFIYSIRKWVKLRPEQAIFIYIGHYIPASHLTMEEVYAQHKSKDGLLRITYSSENTFG